MKHLHGFGFVGSRRGAIEDALHRDVLGRVVGGPKHETTKKAQVIRTHLPSGTVLISDGNTCE